MPEVSQTRRDRGTGAAWLRWRSRQQTQCGGRHEREQARKFSRMHA
jgi:hypothetical protein